MDPNMSSNASSAQGNSHTPSTLHNSFSSDQQAKRPTYHSRHNSHEPQYRNPYPLLQRPSTPYRSSSYFRSSKNNQPKPFNAETDSATVNALFEKSKQKEGNPAELQITGQHC